MEVMKLWIPDYQIRCWSNCGGKRKRDSQFYASGWSLQGGGRGRSRSRLRNSWCQGIKSNGNQGIVLTNAGDRIYILYRVSLLSCVQLPDPLNMTRWAFKWANRVSLVLVKIWFLTYSGKSFYFVLSNYEKINNRLVNSGKLHYWYKKFA